ncbi:MAG TPA: SRPBCC family protein [Noviherbaspirillum sp.]
MMQDQARSPEQTGQAQASLPHTSDVSPEYSAESPPHASHSYEVDRFADIARAERLAKTLGWFSIGLGLAQVLAPHRMSRAVGIDQRPRLMQTLGVREIASGVGILTQRQPAGWLWSRVAGDAMDLALLGAAARSPRSDRRLVSLATALVAGVTVLDLLSSVDNTRRQRAAPKEDASGEVRLEKSLIINRSPEECYRFWHDFENFPRFMKHLESVRITGDNRMRWKAKGPAGLTVEWDAELLSDEPGQYLAWRSLQHADVDNAGTVRFEDAPGGRGTIVRVQMHYRPPGGAAGSLVAKLFGEEPSQQIDEDLRRFKWLIETGEIPTTIGQPSGPRGMMNRLLFRKGAPG